MELTYFSAWRRSIVCILLGQLGGEILQNAQRDMNRETRMFWGKGVTSNDNASTGPKIPLSNSIKKNGKRGSQLLPDSPADFLSFKCKRLKIKLRNVPLQNLELIEVSLSVRDLSFRGMNSAIVNNKRANTNSLFGNIGVMLLTLEPKRGRQTSGALDGRFESESFSFLILEDFTLFEDYSRNSNWARWQSRWMRKKSALNTMGWEFGRLHGNLKLIETSGAPLDMIILEKVLVTILSQEHILDNDESDINLCGVELLIDVKEKLVSFAFLFTLLRYFYEHHGSNY